MPNQPEIFDVTIIGGGPVGLFTAFYSGMREMKTKIIEYLPYLGGKVSYFYPEKMIRDIGGIKQLSGEQLAANLIEQAMTFDPTIVLSEQVEGMERLHDGTFVLNSSNGSKHYTKTIILATGFGTLKSVKLAIPNAVDFEEKSLHYSIKKISDYKGKKVLISGGGNSAVDWANELEPIADKVTLIYRKSNFSGIESNLTKLMKSSVNVLFPYEIVKINGENGRLTSVVINKVGSPNVEEIMLDSLIVNHGFHIDLGPIAEWGLNMNEDMIQVNNAMSTSIPGIFAVGDIADYPNKLSLIAGGFNEGPIAVNGAKQFISPKEAIGHLYSTHYEPLIKNNKRK
ncbi:NAD(P)/FAD-dependent oxidoreductase [Oceanobacillus piezotolerans]|uniref:Ferredoxin--NADP reductase n=1 Tax=Oceanobacillus piezotolerans TaxID=2448030 RepID=A0A498D882_9BACI|nr:NAD(P)/FAD-dependent oxidoreductase [Oceanobacillus piezotolerans]RLL46583.1 NAD(P)/FAD-dependent oxidoreductase [Oceanobacillus piezotolerans]